MRHLRSDYDAIQPFPVKRQHIVKIDGETVDANQGIEHLGKRMDPLIPDDEPVFLLRGQDPAAANAVRAYARLARALGSDPEMCNRIMQWADEMEQYAATKQHGVPDVPEGMLR
jgi:hypothetical protein